MIKTNSRGFTLIELLVVIAIIGILASVVLASLNSARDKGADAAITSTINNTRAQAALYYEDNNDYDGFCATLTAAEASVNDAGGAGSWDCYDSDPTTYAVSGQLSDPTEYYCVDATGSASTTASAASAGTAGTCS